MVLVMPAIFHNVKINILNSKYIKYGCGAPPDAEPPLSDLLLLLEKPHHVVDGIWLFRIALPAKGVLEESGGQSLHVGREFRIGCGSLDSERNAHTTDVGLHFESQLVG